MNQRTRHHADFLAGFPVVDDCLTIGGLKVDALASRVGRTPFYAYDRRLVSRRVAELRAAMPDDLHIHYAVKANPMPALVQHILPQVDGLDVASVGEMQVALSAGCDPGLISFAGPGKRDTELRSAAAAGITINVESTFELQRLCAAGDALGIRPRVAIRVNPNFELKTSGMKMGGGPKQFGIDAELVPDVLRSLHDLDVEFVGLHIFSGSQNLNAEAIMETQEKTVDLALRLAQDAPAAMPLLNIGGGLGIAYFPGDQPLSLAPIGESLGTLLQRVKTRLPDTQVAMELGRYLVGEAGVYVCRVIERKLSRGQVFLVTDGGLHQHLAASGNFGQVIRKNYPVVIANRINGDTRETASVVGPLCTPLDLLADRMELAQAEAGDLVAVLQSGAYGLTSSPINFLSHPAPAEILL
jgi:diaminopimelate decarboxylase